VKKLYLLVLSTLALVLSVWLMWHTLSYDPAKNMILISGKAWSDFGWMLPLARSFSLGNNWPPQNPFYSGAPLKYHFLFHLLVGLLEKAGMRIDWAFNVPSALGFFLLLVMIYKVAKSMFASTKVALLSLLFFLFNGSLSFWEYFQEHGWNIAAVKLIPHNSQYPSFGPWDGSQIAAIWNLNIYTNQRPFGLSLGILLVVVYLLYAKQSVRPLIIGPLLAVLLFINQGLLPALAILIAWHFLIFPNLRKNVIKSLLFVLPFFVYSLGFVNTSSAHYQPGFLMNQPLTFIKILKYWFNNLGLHLILIPLGFLLAPSTAKKLAVPLLVIFLLPNLFQFSPDMFNNHKLFNLFIIFGGMFTAYAITRIKPLVILIPVLIISGIIDFFPTKNDPYGYLPDVQANPDANFFLSSTPSKAVVLNSYWFYHPASIAGRPIFNGYSYFTWAHGYDQAAREREAVDIYTAPDKSTACQLLKSSNISYVELNDHPEGFIHPNWDLWRNQFTPVYRNTQSGTSVYNVSTSCPNSSS